MLIGRAKKGTSPLIMRTRKAARLAAAMGLLTFGPVGAAAAQDAGAASPSAATPVSNPPADQPALAEGVVATVNDDIISSYDLRQRMRLIMITAGVQPTADNLPQIEAEALRDLEDEHLEMQEIKHQEKEQKFTITASDQDVNDEINRMAKNNKMTGDQLLDALARAGVGPETLREQLRAQISWQRWIAGRYGGTRLKISKSQIDAVFAELEAEAAQPQVQISEIFIDASRTGGMDQAMAGAQQLVTQIQQGAPFAAVARQFSSAPTAANGGDAGWMSEMQLPDEVRQAVDQLGPGQLSRPIAVKDGVYIIMVRDKHAGASADLVTLKQAAIALPADASPAQVADARGKLIALKGRLTGCDGLEQVASHVDGVVAGDLGEADVKDLRPDFRDAIAGLKAGEITDPIRTDVGLHLIAVCARRQAGVQLPSRSDVEDRLEDDQLSMIARRYLRDLRNSATIETR